MAAQLIIDEKDLRCHFSFETVSLLAYWISVARDNSAYNGRGVG
jgi:hypothetical protein